MKNRYHEIKKTLLISGIRRKFERRRGKGGGGGRGGEVRRRK